MIRKTIFYFIFCIIFLLKSYTFASQDADSIILEDVLSVDVVEMVHNINLETELAEETQLIIPSIDETRASLIRNNIISYIDKYLITHEEIPENSKIKIAMKYIVPIILGFSAGVPLISPGFKSVEGIPVLPYIVSGGTYLTLGGVAAWLGQIFVAQFDSLSPEEKIIFSTSNRSKNVKIVITSLAAILTSIPDIFAAYKFNGYDLRFAIPSFMYSFVSKQLGFSAFISMLASICECRQSSKTLAEELVNNEVEAKLLDDDTLETEELKSRAKTNFMTVLHTLENTEPQSITHLEQNLKKVLFLKRGIQVISLIFPIANGIVNGVYAYDALGTMYTQILFQAIGCAVILLPSFSLDTALNTAAVGEMYDIIHDKIKGKKRRNFLETFYPVSSTYIIPLTAISLSLCLATTSFYLANETIGASVFKVTGYTIPAITFGTNIILGPYGLINLGHEIFKNSISCFGTAKAKTLTYLSEKVSLMSGFVSSYWEELYQNQ